MTIQEAIKSGKPIRPVNNICGWVIVKNGLMVMENSENVWYAFALQILDDWEVKP